MDYISPRAKIDKSYSLINSRYSTTTVQSKIILSVLSLIRPTDEDFKEYIVPINEFEFLTDNKNHARLRQECKKLMSQVLDIPQEDGSWLFVNWFSKAQYKAKEQTITFRIEKDLMPYLLQMKENFSSVYLANVLKLSSEYGIRIYEMMKQYQKIGSRTIELVELHDLFQTPKSYRARYNNFKQFVLEQATKDINSKTDLNITYKEIKPGRSVTAIHFIVQSKKQLLENEQDTTPTQVDLPFEEYDDTLDMKYDLKYFNDNPENKKMLINNEVHYLKQLYFDKDRNNKLTLKTDRTEIKFNNKNLKKTLDEIYCYIQNYKSK
jgi:plasmid replication initiation protein